MKKFTPSIDRLEKRDTPSALVISTSVLVADTLSPDGYHGAPIILAPITAPRPVTILA